MPDPDGHVGIVEVRNTQGARILDQTHQEIQVPAGQAPSAPKVLPDTAVHAIFGSAMAAQPQAPAHFLLQFESGTATLTQASRPLLGKIVATIRDRSSLDVSVVGHTDTAGSDELNNLLARQRAEAVAKLLTEAGVDPRILEIASHGKAIPPRAHRRQRPGTPQPPRRSDRPLGGPWRAVSFCGPGSPFRW